MGMGPGSAPMNYGAPMMQPGYGAPMMQPGYGMPPGGMMPPGGGYGGYGAPPGGGKIQMISISISIRSFVSHLVRF